jgi:hypothetical protein
LFKTCGGGCGCGVAGIWALVAAAVSRKKVLKRLGGGLEIKSAGTSRMVSDTKPFGKFWILT